MPRNASLERALLALRGQPDIIAAAERISRFGTYAYDFAADEAVWSPELKRMFALPVDDLPVSLRDAMERIHVEDRPSVRAFVRCFRAIGDRAKHDFRIVRPGGEIRHLHSWGELVRIEEYDQPLMVGTIQDVTAEHRAERLIRDQAAALAQAEHLHRSAQSAMATMAATLAHELNQPLTAMMFFASAARRMASAGHADDAIELLASLEENAMRAGDIIRRLRDSVRLGRRHAERFGCRRLIDEAIRFSAVGCEGVRFVRQVDDAEIAGADRVQIQQVLVNLIRNACQAVAGRAAPEIRVAAETIHGEAAIRFTVEDNGPGIPPDLLPCLFEAGITTKQAGMGMGLSISRTIVEDHHGRIWAENGPGGARFAFEIPLDQQDGARREASRA